MLLKYDERGDSAAVLVRGEIGPADTAEVCQLDSDRIARYDEAGQIIEYQFLNARRLGVRLDDLPHRPELEQAFRAQRFPERDWSEPVQIVRVRRRRNVAASKPERRPTAVSLHGKLTPLSRRPGRLTAEN